MDPRLVLIEPTLPHIRQNAHLDEWHSARVLEQSYDRRILLHRLIYPRRIAHTGIEALDTGAVFDADGHTGKRTLLIALFRPDTSPGDHDFRQAIRLFVAL